MANAVRVADKARGWFIGTYAGTTAAQNIHIGFKPALIIGWNFTDGDKVFIWHSTSVTKVLTIDTEAANECIAITQIDNGTVLGFSLPACTASVNEDAKTFYFIAFPA